MTQYTLATAYQQGMSHAKDSLERGVITHDNAQWRVDFELRAAEQHRKAGQHHGCAYWRGFAAYVQDYLSVNHATYQQLEATQ